MSIKIITLVLFITFSSTLFAQTNVPVQTNGGGNALYLGGSLGVYDELLDSSSALGASFHIGYDLMRYFAVEGNLGFAYDSYADNAEGISVDVDAVLSNASLYLRANAPFDEIKFFALVGASYVRMDANVDVNVDIQDFPVDDFESSIEIDETDLSYGAGVDFFATPNTALTIKWLRVIDIEGDNDTEGGELDAWFLGFTHYLGGADHRRF
jgi:opacity protein-like surface antigen